MSSEVVGQTLVDGSEITLTFEADGLSLNAGCNSMSAQFTIEEGELEVGEIAQTLMACEEPLMNQDEWLAAFLGDSPAVSLDGDTLTLSEDDVTLTFTEQA